MPHFSGLIHKFDVRFKWLQLLKLPPFLTACLVHVTSNHLPINCQLTRSSFHPLLTLGPFCLQPGDHRYLSVGYVVEKAISSNCNCLPSYQCEANISKFLLRFCRFCNHFPSLYHLISHTNSFRIHGPTSRLRYRLAEHDDHRILHVLRTTCC